MSLFTMALGGVGAGAADLANKYIDQELQQQKAAALAEIQRTNALQTEAGLYAQQNAPARLEAQRQAAEANARGAARVKRDLDVENMTDPRLREAVQSQAGFDRGLKIDDARALATVRNETTPYELSPGQVRGVNGQKVDENKRPTSQEVQQSLYERALKVDGSSRTSKVDHETDRRWAKVFDNPPKEIVSYSDETTGKTVPSPTLTQVYRDRVMRLRQIGDDQPDEAAVKAGETAQKLYTAAEKVVQEARVKDRKSTLTIEQAAMQILQANEKVFAAAQRQPGDPATAQRANPAARSVPNPFGPADTAPVAAPRSLASVAASAAPAASPAAAASPKPAAPKLDLDAARQQVESLRAQARQANEELRAYGARQRSANPAGFNDARALLAAVERQLEDAQRQLAIVERTASDEAVRPRTR